MGARRFPDALEPDGVEDGGRHLGIRLCGDEEADVAGSAPGEEPLGAPGEVGTDHDISVCRPKIVTAPVTGSGSSADADRSAQAASSMIRVSPNTVQLGARCSWNTGPRRASQLRPRRVPLPLRVPLDRLALDDSRVAAMATGRIQPPRKHCHALCNEPSPQPGLCRGVLRPDRVDRPDGRLVIGGEDRSGGHSCQGQEEGLEEDPRRLSRPLRRHRRRGGGGRTGTGWQESGKQSRPRATTSQLPLVRGRKPSAASPPIFGSASRTIWRSEISGWWLIHK